MSSFLRLGRRSGILLHPTSLPGPFGIGDLGRESRWFMDCLAAAKQKIWCMLPLGPTGPQNSPYESRSAFAGNPSLISPELLVEHGYLQRRELRPAPSSASSHVNFRAVRRYKKAILQKAFASFVSTKDFRRFESENQWWLEDFSKFMSVRDANPGSSRLRFDKTKTPDPESARFHKFVQYEFFRQWKLLRRYAKSVGISIMGDLPFYVEADGADVWGHPELFNLDRKGTPKTVGGVPPDYFSRTGQRWGTPTYRWETLKKDNFRWWIDRLRFNFEMVDLLRLDHFRGFEAYWSVEADEPTARKGRWKKGPGALFFKRVRKELGDVPLIAENLGLITPEVEQLRNEFGLPGMAVLQFGFEESGIHRPTNYIPELVCYTGTHDNDTTVGWWNTLNRSSRKTGHRADRAARDRVLSYFQFSGDEIHWRFIREVLISVAQIAIFPMQDLLGLPSNARMNQPGRAQNNWRWRLEKHLVTPSCLERLAELTVVSGR